MAIADIVIKQREQVIIVHPVDGILPMKGRKREEVKPTSGFKDEVTAAETSEVERSLA